MTTSLVNKFIATRELTLKLVEQLNPEDTVVQPIVDVSPPKWHLAHTTWFFENFILKKYRTNFKPYHPLYDYLFNSYYQSQGTRVARDMRGYHPRPLLKEIIAYRQTVDAQMLELMRSGSISDELLELIELGINHEQQHQELLITDLKYIWGLSPLFPVYKELKNQESPRSAPLSWLSINEGIYEIGELGTSFHFDNESPRHNTFLHRFEIASRPVNVGEYLDFMEDGGYKEWRHWLHEGWQWLNSNQIEAPLYWQRGDSTWLMYTLNGLRELNREEILTHISFYEADAFARWKGLRLPTEQEWEVAAGVYGSNDSSNNFLDNQLFHPSIVTQGNKAFLGEVWEWTNSAYLPYPKFKPWEGSVGEYNGKFMVNQMVLRGGSCATPKNHIRATYRNFFHPHLRWQFTGARLARDL
ncbi:MAG TPA: ergothioneine biosynthesis protein EgtB [Williamwhitmania sp.]|nr:ergothioneine biosynthesis protein EgtB [Williamwhitmania sp.]